LQDCRGGRFERKLECKRKGSSVRSIEPRQEWKALGAPSGTSCGSRSGSVEAGLVGSWSGTWNTKRNGRNLKTVGRPLEPPLEGLIGRPFGTT